MEEVAKLLKTLDVPTVQEGVVGDGKGSPQRILRDSNLCSCCCQSHCSLSLHVARGVPLVKETKFEKPVIDVGISAKLSGWDYGISVLDDYLVDERSIMDSSEDFRQDSFLHLMTALNMDLSGDSS